MRVLIPVLVLVVPSFAAGQANPVPAYRDATRPIAERVVDLLGRMTLEEKFWQVYMSPGSLDDPSHDYSDGSFGLQVSTFPDNEAAGAGVAFTPGQAARAHAERINAIQRHFVERTRLGIPIVPFDEALHGLVQPGATVFPQAIALAATWDTALVADVATAIARETASRGVRQVLSPVVNIADDVRWGRVEETYGEDPLLTSSMAGAFVRAFERAGIIATPKHFVANVGNGGRDSYPIERSRRWLEELHFPPFRAALDAGARSVMTAYNSVDGSPATQNRRLLNETLKRDWGFTGFVISDAAATGGATVLHMTEASTASAAQHALAAGLDVIFQSTWEQHRPYLDAFRRGLIADSVIDLAVSRVLRAKFESGLFENPYVDADSAERIANASDHRDLARRAARSSIVLLRNDGALPFAPGTASIAVLGIDAEEARLGGYSGPGHRRVSILDGIRARAGAGVSVRFAPGPGRVSHEYHAVPTDNLGTIENGRPVHGLRGEYFDNNRLEGTPLVVRIDPNIDFSWTLNSPARGVPRDWYSIRWTGTLTAPASGARRIGITGNDGYRLWLDDRLILDHWRKQSFGTHAADFAFEPGRTYDLRIEFFESTGNARIQLIWNAGITDDWRSRIDDAVAVAKTADVAVIVAGIEEGEFRDRARLGLPGHQEALIDAVTATGRPTVIVTTGGSAITMPWLDRVGAVLHAWYPGEQGGTAIAGILFGDASPAGRLPITFPIAEGQLPLVYNHKPTGRGDDYIDLTGHPLFPFGFGLSYTTFEYSNLTVEPASITAGQSALVRARIRNTGALPGDEVVQLYLRDVLASVARPVIQLAGFRRIRLAPGEEQDVSFSLTPQHLAMLDEGMNHVIEPGTFRVLIGASSTDIRLRGELVVR
jgi:beta-glucosidase